MRHYTELLGIIKKDDLTLTKSLKKVEYYNIEAGFDIETTSIKNNDIKSAFMYIWQFGLGYGNDVVYGRTWDEFLDCMEMLSEHLGLSESKRLVIYVHNLAYEFQFMYKYFTWLDVFSVSERKPIRALCSLGIEFRDSYILSGSSLAVTAKNLSTHKVKKLVGDLDYSLTRHHKTILTDAEMDYCNNDIEIILAYINEQITLSGDISKIPMTNTGRVRKYVRNVCYGRDGVKKGASGRHMRYKKIMDDLTLEPEIYIQLKRAFMGGFTHANANYSGEVLENVTSIDFTSAYPSVMISEKFPMSRFKPVEIKNLNQLDQYCAKYAVVFDAKFENIQTKITQESYISESKCREILNPTINNGRIQSADSISVTITDVDFDIMSNCYSWDSVSIKNANIAHKAYLPKPIIESVLKLYQDKTELKDVAGFEVEYLLSKGMLNSIYGMCVTDVVKEKAVFDGDEWGTEIPLIPEEVEAYNESRNRFLYYAWGVWITAYSRKNLWTGILAVGDDYIYSDTDSLKLLNHEKHKPYINWFDNQMINKMENMCDSLLIDKKLLSPKTKEGNIKMMGVWDYEGTYERFKTLGAKRYLYQKGDKMEITVAGLSKQNGLNHMLEICDNDKLKVFDLFNDELHIPSDKTGKMTHTYIDEIHSIEVTDYNGLKTMVHSLSGVHLENCEFTLSISSKYKEFIQQLSNGYLYTGVQHV